MLHSVTQCYTVLHLCYTALHSVTLVLHSVTQCYTRDTVLHSVTLVLHSVTQCYTVLHSVTQCYTALHLCYTVLHSVTHVLHSVTQCYTALHLCYTVLHSVTQCYTVLQCSQDNTAPPHEEEYFYYIEHERKHGDPARVICLMERAITDNPLNSNRWVDYLRYLVSLGTYLQGPTITIHCCIFGFT